MAHRPLFYRALYALAASACFLALATDLTYLISADFIWLDMSDWLVSIGAVAGFVALVLGVIEIILAPRWMRPSWLFGLFSLLALATVVLNAFIHSRDGLTSVEPLGLGLSAATCVLLFLAWWTNAFFHRDQTAAEIPA